MSGWMLVAAILMAAAAHGPLAEGEWGGPGARLSVTAEGATLEMDCAHGSLDAPLVPDDKGRFEVRGGFFREHGGPVRKDESTAGTPVRYRGSIDGATLTLTILPADADEPMGSYTLEHGKHGRLMKCR